MSSEVQSAYEIREMEIRLLQLELERPLSPLAIGGSMCWSYEIADAIVVLRRSQLEGQLGLVERRHSIDEVVEAARVVFAAVEDRLWIFFEADRPVHARTEPWRLQTLAKYALLERVGLVREVRAVQREAAGDAPLTVCFGRSQRSAYEVVVGAKGLPAAKLQRKARELAAARETALPGHSYSRGDGCGRAHFESTSPYRLLTRYCSRCAKQAGNRQRAIERRYWAEADGHAGGRGTDECTSCREKFESTRPNQRRCPKCRESHRPRAKRLP